MEYPRVAEVAYTTLDWMTKHRATIGQTDDLWKHVTSLFPQDNELIPWSQMLVGMCMYCWGWGLAGSNL